MLRQFGARVPYWQPGNNGMGALRVGTLATQAMGCQNAQAVNGCLRLAQKPAVFPYAAGFVYLGQ